MSIAPPTQIQPYVPPLHGPWPAGSGWSRRWPRTGRPATRATVLGVAASAVVAALAVPLDRGGLGWLLAALAGTAALVVSRVFGQPTDPDAPPPLVIRPEDQRWRPGPDRVAWGAATVALIAVGTFRAAGWLFLLCLATATLTGALSLTGGRSVRSITTGYAMQVMAGFGALPWLSRGARRRRAGTGPNVRIAATITVSVTLLAVFGALFVAADPAFAKAVRAVVPDLSVGTAFRWILLGTLTTMIVGGAALLRTDRPDLSGLDGTEGRKVNRLEWAVPLGSLVALFGAFVTVQATVLFGGERHVLGTDGLTYAGYARGGFWQLSFVTGLALLVLAGAARWAPRTDPTDRVLIRVIPGALAVLTLVIVASALQRMSLYADTYGLTRLRLLVACCELWFGLVLILVLLAGVRIRAPWLPRVAIAAGVAALLGLAVANPDRLIAEYNIPQDRTVDLLYLGTLSPDAVPALTALDPGQRQCVLARIRAGMEPDDWRGWNLGRERARDVFVAQLDGSAPICP
jgi:hypothetical protein